MRWPPRCKDHEWGVPVGGVYQSSKEKVIYLHASEAKRGVEGSLQRYANLVLLRQLHLIDRAGLTHLMPYAVLVGTVGVIRKEKR